MAFDFEFYSEDLARDAALREEAEASLRELAEGRHDMIGASVAIEAIARGETDHLYEARVVAYIKPDNVVATEKGRTPQLALSGALDAVERQIRQQRQEFRKPWQQP